MNILMTGGTGLIGRSHVRAFSRHRYTVLSRSKSGARRVLPSSVRIIRDLSELENLNGFDAVINLAGEPIVDKRWTEKQKRIICDSRWNITQQLADLFEASDSPPPVFVSGSAIGVYGDSGDHKVTEQDSPFTTNFAHVVCQGWEAIAGQASELTRVIYLRTGIVLDSKGGALAKMLLPFKFGLGGRIGTGKQFMSWIHIEDMTRAIDYLIATESATGPFNLTSPNPVSNQEFTNTLASVLRRKALLPVPEKLLRTIMGESADLLLNSQTVLPEKLLQSGFEFVYPNLRPALTDLLRN